MKNASWISWLCLTVCLAACANDSDQKSSRGSTSAPTTPSSAADDDGEHDLADTPGSLPMSAPGTGAAATPARGESAAKGGGAAASAGPTPTPSASPAPPSGAASAAATPSTTPSSAPAPSPRDGAGNAGPGVLTAGTWDDNRNYERFLDYRDEHAQLPGVLSTDDAEHDSAHDEFSAIHGPRDTLDVALVIDTTGSMGDEIRYLQSEFQAITTSIADQFPNSTQRWALIVYRDEGDEYVTRSYDFSDDAGKFSKDLGGQLASGGGDFPEAPDAALAEMVQLDWRTDLSSARLAFWVADAPHHAKNAAAMTAAIRAARSIDVHVYPVASSGVDELTELTMRSAAQLTGGRYLFLTDDSGVGGAHKEPSIPCYFVTHLDQAILRMVEIELSGMYREPSQDQIIRRGGDPQNGTCKLASGEVQIF